MSSFVFLRPWWLLMILPAAYLWWRLWVNSDKTRKWQQFIDPHLLQHLLVHPEKEPRIRPIHLLGSLWLTFIVALSGPSWRYEQSPFAEDRGAMVLLLKVTESMLNKDVQPTRLSRAKIKIQDLLNAHEGGSTALIVYSGSAHTVMPLTKDSRIISLMAEDITPEIMPVKGDALTDALELADAMLTTAGLQGSIVVCADGVSPTQLPALHKFEVSSTTPIQFLCSTWRTEGAPGVSEAARAINARITSMTADDSDVRGIASRAASDVEAVFDETSGDRRQDGGALFIPLIAIIAAFWCRKRWRVT